MSIKHLGLLLIIFLTACQSSKTTIQTTFNIEESTGFKEEQKQLLKQQLETRLWENGYKKMIIAIKDNQVVVQGKVNWKKPEDKEQYYTLFESNKLSFWPTFRMTDSSVQNLDTTIFTIPAFKKNPAPYPESVLGICYEESQLLPIATTLTKKLVGIQNLKLAWSIATNNYVDVDTPYHQLHLINTEGQVHPSLTEQDIVNASAQLSVFSNRYEVAFQFTPAATKIWYEMTDRAANDNHRNIVMILNNSVVMAPRVMQPIAQGRVNLSGDFTKEEAEKLAQKISLGRLIIDLALAEEKFMDKKKK